MKPKVQLALAATIIIVAASVLVWVVRRDRTAKAAPGSGEAAAAAGADEGPAGVNVPEVRGLAGARLSPAAFAALPKEVREAAAGRRGPDVDRMPVGVRLAVGGSAAVDAGGGSAADGGGIPAGEGADVDEREGSRAAPSAREQARRASWIDRQQRRNQLRAEVLRTELGASVAEAELALAALDRFALERVKLFEAADAGLLDQTGISGGLGAIRSALADELTGALGPATYRKLTELEAEGRFVLPDEVKKPAR